MSHKSFIFCMLLLTAGCGSSDTDPGSPSPLTIVWQKSLGGTEYDDGESIISLPDGGFVVAGWSASHDGDVQGYHGGTDGWVVRLDGNGNVVWQKALGGTLGDQIASVIAASDGGFVVAGQTDSNNGDVSGNHGQQDWWIVKLDGGGNIVWQKTLGGAGFESAHSIIALADGGFVIAGLTNSNDGDVSGNHGGIDYWVVKIDGSGDLVWQKTFGGTGDDSGKSITATADGGYVVAGDTRSNDGDVIGSHSGLQDYWLVKLDGNGGKVWSKTLGGTSEDGAMSVVATSDGGYVVAGYVFSSDGDVNGSLFVPNNYWIVKLDGSANIMWQKIFGGSKGESAHSICMTSDGGFVAAGYSSSNDGDLNVNFGFEDYWLVKIDADGNKVWQKVLGGTKGDAAWSIIETSDAGFAVAGSSFSNDRDVNGNHGGTDSWVVRLKLK